MASEFQKETIMKKNKATSEHNRKRDAFIIRKNLEKHQHIFEQYEAFGKELTAKLRQAMLEKAEPDAQQYAEQVLDQAAE
jgi:hypothetical protein